MTSKTCATRRGTAGLGNAVWVGSPLLRRLARHLQATRLRLMASVTSHGISTSACGRPSGGTPDAGLRYGQSVGDPAPQRPLPHSFLRGAHQYTNDQGRLTTEWVDTEGRAGDAVMTTPIPGYMTGTVTTRAPLVGQGLRRVRTELFHQGDYEGAVAARCMMRTSARFSTDDNIFEGKELRSSRSTSSSRRRCQDIIRRYKSAWKMHASRKGLPVFRPLRGKRTPSSSTIRIPRSPSRSGAPLIDVEHSTGDTAGTSPTRLSPHQTTPSARGARARTVDR